MARIFISYSRADRQFLDNFLPLIRKVYGNDSLWYDDDIHGGADWWQMILREIGQCDLFIYLISNESLESPYCQAELREALRLHKQILPVIVRRLKPAYPGNIADDLKPVLSRIQYVDLAAGFKDSTLTANLYAAINRLMYQVSNQPLVPKSAAPTPLPSVPDKLKSWWQRLTEGQGMVIAAVIGLVGVLGAALITLLANQSPSPSSTQATTTNASTVAVELSENTEEATPEVSTTSAPMVTPSDTPTISSTEIVEITNAELDISTVLSAAGMEYYYARVNGQLVNVRSAPHTEADVVATLESGRRVFVFERNDDNTWVKVLLPSREEGWIAISLLNINPMTYFGMLRNTDWTPLEHDFDGMTMVLVPTGCFIMGGSQSENIKPEHLQCLDEPFWLDKYEVTNAKYRGFVEAGGYENPSYWTEAGWQWRQENNITAPHDFEIEGLTRPAQPRVGVSWYEAVAYANWRGCRLPTEAEWEFAARGPDGLIYPWGNTWNSENVVWSGNSNSRTADVGSRPGGASWVGALDMSGNVWEWVSSQDKAYPYMLDDGREDLTGEERRVLRGGSWIGDQNYVRAVSRSPSDPFHRYSNRGIRVVCPAPLD